MIQDPTAFNNLWPMQSPDLSPIALSLGPHEFCLSYSWSVCVCVCVCARARARASAHACVFQIHFYAIFVHISTISDLFMLLLQTRRDDEFKEQFYRYVVIRGDNGLT
jgi:prolipoprotein diacylglyceryltransferase